MDQCHLIAHRNGGRGGKREVSYAEDEAVEVVGGEEADGDALAEPRYLGAQNPQMFRHQHLCPYLLH